MKPTFFTGPVRKIFWAVAAVLAFALVLYLMSGMPAPREEDRVGPVNGSFSIIKPPDWESEVVYSVADRYFVTVVKAQPARSVGIGPMLVVGLLRDAPDLQKLQRSMVASRFQDQDAMIFSGPVKREYLWKAIFRRGEKWFELSLTLPKGEDIEHGPWQAYLNSFRANAETASRPASFPATIGAY